MIPYKESTNIITICVSGCISVQVEIFASVGITGSSSVTEFHLFLSESEMTSSPVQNLIRQHKVNSLPSNQFPNGC